MWLAPSPKPTYIPTPILVTNSSIGVEAIKIDPTQLKCLIIQEKKQHILEGLYLYCQEYGHKAQYCPKKHCTFEMRSATTSNL